FQTSNGAISNSAAASAMVFLEAGRRPGTIPATSLARLQDYIHSRDPDTTGYLDRVPHFVTAWAVMVLSELGLSCSDIRDRTNSLYAELCHPSGLLCTVGETSIPGDTDSTACAFLAAHYANYPVRTIDSLDLMYRADQGYYLTFLFERDASLS